jgi:hypothetical protein
MLIRIRTLERKVAGMADNGLAGGDVEHDDVTPYGLLTPAADRGMVSSIHQRHPRAPQRRHSQTNERSRPASGDRSKLH